MQSCWLKAIQEKVKIKHLPQKPLSLKPPKPGAKRPIKPIKKISLIGQRSIVNFQTKHPRSSPELPDLNPSLIIRDQAARLSVPEP